MTAVSQGDEVPTLDVDPFSLEFLDEPYPHYQRMRDIGPLVRLRAYEVWGMARFNEVHAALRDPATYCSSAGVGLSDFRREEPWRAPSLLLEADPPEHDRARRVITKVLTPMVVGELRASFEAKVEQLVDELVEVREFDAVEDLAVRFPMTVFPDAVGLQQDGRANLLRYSTMAFNAFGPRNSLFERSMVGVDSAREWIMDQCRREALRPGAIGARVHDVAAEEGYGSEEADLLVRSLLSAGVDTTVHGIENAIYCFTRHPDQWARLRTDPSLARAAFEEAVRYESPVQTFFRTTAREVEVGDVVVPEGEKVLLFLGSANRDPRHWGESADQFDIQRRAAGHVGFGSGIHACVGQMLARLEGELVLTALGEEGESDHLHRRARAAIEQHAERFRPSSCRRRGRLMPRVVYVQDDGSEQIVEGQIGQSVMEIAVDAGVEGIVAECGGNMMCATCHVYVDGGWIDKVGAVDDGQNAMLQETAAPRLENSRLSCQLLLSEQIDGLRVRVPPEQV